MSSLKSFRSSTSAPKIVFGNLRSCSECNRVTKRRSWPSQVALEFYRILQIVKVDTGWLKICNDSHSICKDLSISLKTCTESFKICSYI